MVMGGGCILLYTIHNLVCLCVCAYMYVHVCMCVYIILLSRFKRESTMSLACFPHLNYPFMVTTWCVLCTFVHVCMCVGRAAYTVMLSYVQSYVQCVGAL